MKPLINLILLLTVLCPQATKAGYKELMDEFNAYTPPDYIISRQYSSEGALEPEKSQSSSFEN